MSRTSWRGGCGSSSRTCRNNSGSMLARNGTRPGEQLVEHHAQAVDVGAAVDAVGRARGLFRRHVPRGAGDESLFAAACLVLAQGEAEVHQHRRAFGGENDVGRLDVAVDDQPRVGVRQSVGHGGDDPRRLLPGRAVVPQPAAEVGAFEVIGDDIDLPSCTPTSCTATMPGWRNCASFRASCSACSPAAGSWRIRRASL